MAERPEFISSRGEVARASPEELFLQLERARTHGYLRGPQQDILRQYVAEPADESDVALELPTGTGKTAIGLLIAEWRRRRSRQPVAYLTLTNQLAHQVMEEAKRLGVDYADITGDRSHRDPAAEGRYRTAQAIGVTTYSNLFNIHAVIASPSRKDEAISVVVAGRQRLP
jgi:superfamily II DNA or RNA helicase